MMAKMKDTRIRDSVNAQVDKFFTGFKRLTILERAYPGYLVKSVSVLINDFIKYKCLRHKVIGVCKENFSSSYPDPSQFLKPGRINKQDFLEGTEGTEPAYFKPLSDWGSSQIGILNAIFFITYEHVKMAVYCRYEHSDMGAGEYKISVISRDQNTSNKFTMDFETYENKNNLFRGKILRPKIDYNGDIEDLSISEIKQVDWKDVILPSDIKEEIQKSVLDYVTYFPILKQHELDLKRGIMLHGVPGTGKSYIGNMLMCQLKDFTKIIVTGNTQEQPTSIFELARKLQPTIVIFEDIDLIGGERSANTHRIVLGELMNQWDGMTINEQIICVFTTN
jgi:hypothetical protein